MYINKIRQHFDLCKWRSNLFNQTFLNLTDDYALAKNISRNAWLLSAPISRTANLSTPNFCYPSPAAVSTTPNLRRHQTPMGPTVDTAPSSSRHSIQPFSTSRLVYLDILGSTVRSRKFSSFHCHLSRSFVSSSSAALSDDSRLKARNYDNLLIISQRSNRSQLYFNIFAL